MSSKVILAIALVSALIVGGVLAGCAPAAEPGPEAQPQEEEEEATPAAQETETLVWQLQSHAKPGHYEYDAMVRAVDFINECSGGRLEIEPLAAGAVAPATDEFQAIHNGVLEMAQTGHHNNNDLKMSSGIFTTMSGGLTATQLILWFEAGGGDELCEDWYESALNVEYISAGIIGPEEVWLSSVVPIETVDDLDGLKVRTAGECGDILSRMGCATITMPSGEIYESMQRGVMDAFDYGSATLNWQLSFQEVCDYMYLSPSRSPTTSTVIAANRDAWNDLAPDLQLLVTKAFASETIPLYAWITVQQAEALQNFIDYGIDVEKLNPAIEQAYLDEAEKFYDELAADNPELKEVILSMRAFKAMCELQGIA